MTSRSKSGSGPIAPRMRWVPPPADHVVSPSRPLQKDDKGSGSFSHSLHDIRARSPATRPEPQSTCGFSRTSAAASIKRLPTPLCCPSAASSASRIAFPRHPPRGFWTPFLLSSQTVRLSDPAETSVTARSPRWPKYDCLPGFNSSVTKLERSTGIVCFKKRRKTAEAIEPVYGKGGGS